MGVTAYIKEEDRGSFGRPHMLRSFTTDLVRMICRSRLVVHRPAEMETKNGKM